MTTYLFHRAEGFYPITIPAESLMDNIEANPGTTKVTDPETGAIIWRAPDPDDDFDEPLGKPYCGIDGACESCQ